LGGGERAGGADGEKADRLVGAGAQQELGRLQDVLRVGDELGELGGDDDQSWSTSNENGMKLVARFAIRVGWVNLGELSMASAASLRYWTTTPSLATSRSSRVLIVRTSASWRIGLMAPFEDRLIDDRDREAAGAAGADGQGRAHLLRPV
jgi:hypothetical protein